MFRLHKIILLLTSISVLAHFCYCEYSHTIYIDARPTVGNDTGSCITSNSPSVPCKSLNWAFLTEHRSDSTQYVLLKGPHIINASIVTFENLEQIAFVGNESTTSNVEVRCTAPNAGLAFIDVTDVSFIRLTFTNCYTVRNSTSRNFTDEEKYSLLEINAGLYFYHCRNVFMQSVTVTKSPNVTGVVMYDTDGTNKITQSRFTDNVPFEEGITRGGGGFYIEFSYCVPGDSNCRDNQEYVLCHESRNSDAWYIFSECKFVNNTASASTNSTFVIPYRADHEAFGRGGGLSIFIKGNATGNRFDISNCQFESNRAVWGGGLFVELQDDSSNNTIQVTNSTFKDNTCHYTADSGTSGGGMRIGHYIYGYHAPNSSLPLTLPGNTISLNECNFTHNSALNGGGLSVSASLQNYGVDFESKIYINNTKFVRNTAKLGAALHIDRFSAVTHGHMLLLYIMNGQFLNNNIQYLGGTTKNQPHEVGLGAVYTHQIRTTFLGNNTNFYGNNGTALAVISTEVDFTSCQAVFDTNHGLKGGAVALLGSAYILISSSTNFGFYRNLAMVYGGGIYNQYIARETLKSYTDCFIRHVNPFLTPDHWNATFYFFDNYEQDGRRSAIYTTSILPCSFAAGSDRDQIFHWRGWDYSDSNGSNVITSDIGNIDYTGSGANHDTVKAFPGIPFKLPLMIEDDYNSSLYNESIFSASADTPNANIGEFNLNFTYVQGESTVVRGLEDQSVTLVMDNLGDRVWHVNVVVELDQCPPGFIANTSKGLENTFCDCANRYGGTLLCDSESFNARLRNGNWLGKLDEDDNYLSAVCPPGYCFETLNHSAHFLLPKDPVELDALICGMRNRNGTLCGRCLEGFGPAVNSVTYECVNCTNENIAANVAKYVASVYIPLTILFTILILFDIRLTTGPANAFILYSQVVASTFDLSAGGQIPLNRFVNDSDNLLKAYRFPYGIFNLEFIENFLPPLCLGTELNNLSVFLLHYVVALSPLLMILIVVLCVKIHIWIAPKCRRNQGRRWERLTSMSFSASYHAPNSKQPVLRKGISEAVLPAFAAFLLLSYTKFTLASAYLLSYRHLINEDGYVNATARVYFAGHMAYNSKDYLLPYFVPACLVFATVGLITPLFFMDYPLRAFEWCLRKMNCLWRFYPVDKVHVFLDTFQGCYKIKMRFFAGLYFLFRLTISVIYLAIDTWLDQFVVQQIACIVMVVLLTICQPYNEENKLFNYVDTLLFLNLAAVNALSLYLYAYTQNYPNIAPSASAFAVQYILVFLPLIFMICYIVWRVTQPCRPKMKNSFAAINRRLRFRKEYQPLDSVVPGVYASRFEGNEDHAEIEAILARAELENTYRPSPVGFDSEPNNPRSRVSAASDQNSSIQSDPALNTDSTDETQ